MAQQLKPIRWIGSAWSDLKSFPDNARNDAGHQLFLVQCGRQPEDFKPMYGIGGGVYEIRIHKEGEHRVFYLAKFSEAVYVLHAFEKRTRKTCRHDIEIGRRRFAQVLATRRA
jgi:phage-related protein